MVIFLHVYMESLQHRFKLSWPHIRQLKKTKATVRYKVMESVSETNPQLSLTIQNIQNAYLSSGVDANTVKGASNAYLNNLIKEQILARSIRDYYDIMLIGLLCLILTLIFATPIQNVVLKLRKGNIPY